MAVEAGLHPLRTRFWILEDRGTLERFVVIGAALSLVGVVLGIIAAGKWSLQWFRQLAPHRDDPAGNLLRHVHVAWRTNRSGRVLLWINEFASGAENSAAPSRLLDP